MTIVYLDACCFIYLVEGVPAWRRVVEDRVRALLARPEVELATSRLTRLECRTKPMREGNTALLVQYERLLSARRLSLHEVTATVIERATDLRARYGFKTPDALHLATALEAGATSFAGSVWAEWGRRDARGVAEAREQAGKGRCVRAVGATGARGGRRGTTAARGASKEVTPGAGAGPSITNPL